MTTQDVLSAQREVFYPALIRQDWDALSRMYADDYTLVRSDGTLLDKAGVLADLKTGALRFNSIELFNEQVRIAGSVGVLTGESRTFVQRNTVCFESHFRLTAVYAEVGGALRLVHFQSTDIPSSKMAPTQGLSGPGLARSFVGTWSLISYVDQVEHLEPIYPFGKDASGVLIYTEDWTVSAQLMRAHRPKLRGNSWDPAHAEGLADLAAGYIAYCGSYTVDEQRMEVVHTPSMALIPNLIDQPQHRGYLLNDTTLVLQTRQISADRGRVETRLVWQKTLSGLR